MQNVNNAIRCSPVHIVYIISSNVHVSSSCDIHESTGVTVFGSDYCYTFMYYCVP